MEKAKDQRPDLNMSGVGQAAGGLYRSVRIDGVCTIATDVECETMDIHGIGKARGNVKADRFQCNGKMNVDGALDAKELRIDGIVRVNGPVAGERIEVNGVLTADGDCEAEKAEFRGWFTIKGLLNAGNVDIMLYGKCEAREIGGETIRVERGSSSVWKRLWQWAMPKLITRLEADVIEGDEIVLEDTTADIVRGNLVRIGKGCKIGRVEYRSDLQVHPQAKVSEQTQL
ncbi:polymer-forming cytoskeletal protein [Cohnella zeiphila]|uniref:Polymer-forming cytoskeletal protein n=1 Tax=Cohnella zeiphila TaxID=2761120 RepID=A0A7X0SRZ3_9BACL|nr:polymer-forming cytoskeletal protein [Cohnella zeiphila]MBB6734876.1 polymer-forming cytoskeletal protein [Cohnella zeiphila]